MMFNRILVFFFLIFGSINLATASDPYDLEDKGMGACELPDGKNTNNCTSKLTVSDGSECLWALAGLPNGSIFPKYPNAQSQGAYGFLIYSDFANVWNYHYYDNDGSKGECRSRHPSVNERVYLVRNGNDPETTTFTVARDYCTARRWWGTSVGSWHCDWWWHEDNDGEEYPGDPWWGDHYSATFNLDDLDGDFKTLYGGAFGGPGIQVAIKRVKKYQPFPHNENSKNPGPRDKACAYIVVGGKDTFLLWSAQHALIGCVDLPGLPGPDVFNTAILTNIVPKVDTTICLDRNAISEKCNTSKTDLLTRGSTFDKPLAVLTNGDKNDLKEVDLRYQFYEDDYDDNIKTCGSIDIEGYSGKKYCAQVPLNQPGKVCICEQGKKTGGDAQNPYNFCGDNPTIGCLPRPSLQQSKLTIVATPVIYVEDPVGNQFNAALPNFVETDLYGSPLYIDSKGNPACLDPSDGKYHVCTKNGIIEKKLAIEPMKFKRRLAIPKEDDQSGYLREYHPDYTLKPYEGAYKKGESTCFDDDGDKKGKRDTGDNDVYYGSDGKFYILDSNGKITNNKAKGDVYCTFKKNPNDPEDKWELLSTKDTPTTFISTDTGSKDLVSPVPTGYKRDSATFYGLSMQSLIPDLSNGAIQFDKYATMFDFPYPEEYKTLTVPKLDYNMCVPITLIDKTEQCTKTGTFHFLPMQDRDRDFCKYTKFEDANNSDRCGKLVPTRGINSADAMKLYCVGIAKDYDPAKDEICINASAGQWSNFRDDTKFDNNCQPPQRSVFCKTLQTVFTMAPAVTEISAESGYTTWPTGPAGKVQIGTCSEKDGFEMRREYIINTQSYYSKQDICDIGKKSGGSCDGYYSEFIKLVDRANSDLKLETLNTWKKDNRNLSKNEIKSFFGQSSLKSFVGNTLDSDDMLFNSYTQLNPTRIVDPYNGTSITNACVAK